MTKALDALALALVVVPVGAVLVFIVHGIWDMAHSSDPAWRMVAWGFAGVMCVMAGIFLATRNDRGW